jgi:hypothetical protein
MAKQKSTRRISLETLVKLESLVKVKYWDNCKLWRASDISVEDLVKDGMPMLVAYGQVVGKNPHYLFIATQHVDGVESNDGYDVSGVLWSCIESVEVLKACSQ